MIAFELPDEAATRTLAARIAGLARPADIVALKGDLGTGKTSFARAFIRACGGREEVPSPTFTLVQVYDLDPVPVWHFDLYRLRTPEEAWELGIEDAFAAAVSLIVWPERLGALLPARHLEIALSFGGRPQSRHVALAGGAEWRERLAGIAAGA